MCWYCYWGWPKPIADIYTEAKRRIDAAGGSYWALHFGPSHIVWEDENFDCAEHCIEHFDDEKQYNSENYTEQELEIVRWSLEELIKIPIEQRESPDGGDSDPQAYPPPAGMTMVRV